VCGDEAAVNLLTTYRTNGWSSQRLRARKRCGFIRGARLVLFILSRNLCSSCPLMSCRYSILPAITVDGIIYSHIKEGSYNGDQFLQWLEGLLRVMNPYPAPHSVLILDNCRIHHVEGVEEMCEDRYVYILTHNPKSESVPILILIYLEESNWSTFHLILRTSTLSKSASLSSKHIFDELAICFVILLSQVIKPSHFCISIMPLNWFLCLIARHGFMTQGIYNCTIYRYQNLANVVQVGILW
jgi:hypothetical protein